MFHLDRLRSICARAKNPTDLVEGKSLDEHAHYTRHRLSQKGKHLWDQIQTSYCYAECLCHIYDFTCCSKIDRKHLPFQCEFNENEILSSYAKGVYDYFDIEKIEEFVAFKGAYEIASLIEKYYDTIHKSGNFAVLAYCFENYICNDYIEDFKNKMLAAQEEANDCYDEESYDSEDSLEISLSEELDTCCVFGQDATMDDAYGDELAIVSYVKHEIVAIAPTLDYPFILLKSPTHIPENFALIKAHSDGLHLSYVPKDRVENYTRVLVGHEQHALCDSYILDVVHDATENYFERGKFGCRNFHVTKTPLFMMKVLKLLLFHLPMLVTLCFHDLFIYKFPRHRKWVRLKCVSYLLLDALFCFKFLFSCEHLL
jgi:hypothetical protein